MSSTAIRSASIRRLADVRMADLAEVGGKAASLGELLAAGVRVPDGVVLTAGVGDMTPDERGILVHAGAEELGNGRFAVRSSGVAEDGADRSYAGMYETVLDVSTDELAAAVERCLASAREARAAEYEPASTPGMAVIIQRMVAPAAAGVALTADPRCVEPRSPPEWPAVDRWPAPAGVEPLRQRHGSATRHPVPPPKQAAPRARAPR